MTVYQPSSENLVQSLLHFMRDIKIQHSVFALPFAAVAFVLSDLPAPTLRQLFLLLVCMVSARSWAMGVNRLLDRKIDAQNPRTASRLVASGVLSQRNAKIIIGFFGLLFVVSSVQLNPLVGILSVPTLVVLGMYSMMKRWSWFCHFYLGICLGMAPVAVNLALTETVSLPVLLVCAAMTFWTAGFDILYALQDFEFDRKLKLHSIPAKLGVMNSKWVSRACFLVAASLLLLVGMLVKAGTIYYVGWIVVCSILIYQHVLLGWRSETVSDLRTIGKAFFNSNAWVSVVYCAATFSDQLFR
jgi:4-hydroxybenzoate polyprenyltransferase